MLKTAQPQEFLRKAQQELFGESGFLSQELPLIFVSSFRCVSPLGANADPLN